MRGALIPDSKIKVSSRSITKVKGLPKIVDLDKFLQVCNEELNKYRKKTHDVFLTSFKGLRSDNKYRRRLDFHTAQIIMNIALLKLGWNKNGNLDFGIAEYGEGCEACAQGAG